MLYTDPVVCNYRQSFSTLNKLIAGMNKTYTFNSTRMWIFLPCLVALITVIPIQLSEFFKDYNRIFGFLFFLILLIISFFIAWILSTNRISVSISESIIKINKVKGLLPYRPKEFSLTDIEEYSFTPDRNYDLLKIKLKNRKTIRILKLDTLIKRNDEFHKLVDRFTRIVNKLNDEKKTEIYRVLNFYETKQGVYIAYIFGFCILFLIIMMIISPNSANRAGIFAAIAGASFYIFQVLNFRRKK